MEVIEKIEQVRLWQLKHKQQGLCRSCNNPAIIGLFLCSACENKHLERMRNWYKRNQTENLAKQQERRQKLQNEERCNHCGVLLEEGEGKRCINCLWVSHKSGATLGGYR